ncbi:MAG: sulfite exporter TauE/SafE family protein [Campylobacterales bacterium]|nr:sulfite exporter TauE/SafE family protein [Campylobacterales bacterium]
MIDLETLSLLTLVLVFSSVLVAGFIHGALGFGFPMVVTPLLALILDLQSAIFITLIPTIFLNLISIFSAGMPSREILKYLPLVFFIFVGSLVGSKLLIMFDADTFKLLLACMIFFYLYTQKKKLDIFSWVRTNPKTGIVSFGLASGFASGTVSVMVPVFIIYAFEIGLIGSVIMVQVMNISFLAGKGTQFFVFAYEGIITKHFLLSSIPFSIVAIGSLFVGMKIRKRIDEEGYKKVVKKVLFIVAAMMVVQYFL